MSTDARVLVQRILGRLTPPAWVHAETAAMTPPERQAACHRVVAWLGQALSADQPEYGAYGGWNVIEGEEHE